MTFFVPVIEGCPLRQSTMQMDIAGQDITLYLLRLLSEKGASLIALGRKLLLWASLWGNILSVCSTCSPQFVFVF